MRLRFLLAALALAGVGLLGPASAQAGKTTAPIGELRLTYDSTVWRVDVTDDQGTITCLVAACLGAVVEVATIEDAEWCDEPVALEAATAAFPEAQRRTMNMFRLTSAALFVGQNWQNDNEGRAIFACLTVRDTRTEFRTRVSADALPARQEDAVFSLLAGLAAPLPSRDAMVMGTMAVLFQPNEWAARGFGGDFVDAPPGAWVVTCLPPLCDGRVDVLISEGPPAEGETTANCLPPEFAAVAASQRGTVTTRDFAGQTEVDFAIAGIRSACPIPGPSQFAACAVVGGVRYFISTVGDPGCNLRPAISATAFSALVHSLRPLNAR